MRAFTDPVARRRLQRLTTVHRLRDPQVLEQLLADIASRIGGQPAIIAALEELEATPQRRRRQVEAGR